ncbi:MAG: hypothetical protein H8E17_08835 [Deltaproteobacteria bacterium]|nr:hypothetical protein [Deltaproteobacteria bacterium]
MAENTERSRPNDHENNFPLEEIIDQTIQRFVRDDKLAEEDGMHLKSILHRKISKRLTPNGENRFMAGFSGPANGGDLEFKEHFKERVCHFKKEISEEDRLKIVDMLKSLIDNDVIELVDTVYTLSPKIEKFNRSALERDIRKITTVLSNSPKEQQHLGRVLLEFTRTLSAYRIRLPKQHEEMLNLLIKSEGSADILCSELPIS